MDISKRFVWQIFTILSIQGPLEPLIHRESREIVRITCPGIFAILFNEFRYCVDHLSLERLPDVFRHVFPIKICQVLEALSNHRTEWLASRKLIISFSFESLFER